MSAGQVRVLGLLRLQSSSVHILVLNVAHEIPVNHRLEATELYIVQYHAFPAMRFSVPRSLSPSPVRR